MEGLCLRKSDDLPFQNQDRPPVNRWLQRLREGQQPLGSTYGLCGMEQKESKSLSPPSQAGPVAGDRDGNSQSPVLQELTVIADRASIGSHGTVTGKAIPLLQTDALVGTRLFGAGGAGAWEGARRRNALGSANVPRGYRSSTARQRVSVLGPPN